MNLEKIVRHRGAILFVLAFVTLFEPVTWSQTPKAAKNVAPQQNGDKQGELQLASARANPLQLRQFLKKMPKGSDLHYHLSGGVYAETFIRDAVEDGLCIDTKMLAITKCSESSGEKSIVPAGDAYK